ncbi:DUF116 domain-containing protein [Candidatus Latescibacterota bacterium]
MNEKNDPIKKPDRVLGDEWLTWSGSLDESKMYNESANLFAFYSSLTLIIILVGLAAVLYLIEPRLYMIHPALVFVARIVTIIAISVLVIIGILLIVSVFTGRNFLFHKRIGQVVATRLFPLAFPIAKRFGIPRDKLGNSFVTFSNAIVKASHIPGNGKTIILIPRCLKPDIKEQVKELGNRAGIGVFSATGGGQARKIIIKERPSAVIGIACERDLVSGIHDVAVKMPTIGVTNKRPEGPCKNTTIDLDEIKNAIKTFTGTELD